MDLFESVPIVVISLVAIAALLFFPARRSRDIVLTPADYSSYYLSPLLNGSRIVDQISSTLIGGSYITTFANMSSKEHGCILCQTETGSVFQCHLVGTPGRLLIETRLSPTSVAYIERSQQCVKSRDELRGKLQEICATFGEYRVGTNDCTHFAQRLTDFLMEKGSEK